MTRDSAAVASPNLTGSAVDDAPSPTANGVPASGSSSGGGGGEEGAASPKSSSAVSTTTSCCGGSSSSSSRSGSDDDDSTAVSRPAAMAGDGCPDAPSLLPSSDDDRADRDLSAGSDGAVATTASPPNIGGRLTFYKDGKFIFQLAAHQQNPCNNRSAFMSPCRWVPVPTVDQQHKNNIKRIGEWSSQYHQNKTIWPYLVADQSTAISGSKSPQQVKQSSPVPTEKPLERNLHQQCQRRTPPPSLIPTVNATNSPNLTTSMVVATTRNIVRRPSRKYSSFASVENVINPHQQNRQPQSLLLRNLSRRSQQQQHQSFIMVATDAIKAQRRSALLLKKQRRRHHQRLVAKTVAGKEPLLSDPSQPPLVNIEHVVRHLWCRRHTSELLRKQLSSNNNVDATVDTILPVAYQNGFADTLCSNASGSNNCQPVFSPSSVTTNVVVTATTTMTTASLGGVIGTHGNGISSPHKKYKLGQHQQQRQALVDNSGKNNNPSPVLPPANNHSITAILSGNVSGAKRGCSTTSLTESETCAISSTVTSTTIVSPVTTPQKNSSLAPLSLLRTLLKSPSCETNSQPVVQVNNNGSGYNKHHTSSSRKRSAVDSQIISPAITASLEVNNSGSRTKPMTITPTIGTNAIDEATAALSVLSQLPTLHHPVGASQLAAAGYFNVLYHQAAMAAAMAYQSHIQLPQSLSKSTPLSQPSSMLSSQFSTISGSLNSWQRQLNRQPSIHPLPETVMAGNGIATTANSTSIIVAPYSSPLPTAIINGNGQLPPATPSPPPLLMHPVHPRHLLLHQIQQQHQQQQYQPVPTIQQPLACHQHKKRQLNSGLKKRTMPMESSAEYGNVEKNNVLAYKESSSSADCMPLNLSKDSVAENVDGANTAATVR